MTTIVFKKDYNINLDVLDTCTKHIKNSRLGLIIKRLSNSIRADGMLPERMDEHDSFFIPKNDDEKTLWDNLRASAKIQIQAILNGRENGKKGGRPKISQPAIIKKPVPTPDTELPPITPQLKKEEFFMWAEQMDQCPGMGGFANTLEQREMFWNHFKAQGFRRKNGMPIRDLKALFKIWIQEDKKKHAQEQEEEIKPRVFVIEGEGNGNSL